MQQKSTQEMPDFIIRSTLGVSLSVILLMIPFSIISIIQDRYLIATLIMLMLLACGTNVWLGCKDQYHNKINLLGILVTAITAAISLYQLEVIASYWSLLLVIALYLILPLKQAWIVNIVFVSVIVPIAWHVLEQGIVLRFFSVLIGTSLFAFTSTHEIYKQYYLLKEQSITDNLTGLYNRSTLQSSLENALHQSDRSNTDMAILMIDIDHFKTINDQFGHDVGDTVLKKTGAFLKQSFRASDSVFRIGGEEFMALIYNSDKTDAIRVAEKLRKEFLQLPLISGHTISISIGVASLQAEMDWKQWMKLGDENLYKAKDNGRNQVVS
ncbi:MAG: hypothetical protein COA83_02975 [Methylophaga sp.]|nr:MAG: hypothetical protein COA83_02975 [Methylophaga sp.]